MSSNAMHVDKILFEDGSELNDCNIMLFENFVIVSKGDAAPDFHSVYSIVTMYGVQQTQSHSGISGMNGGNIWTL